MNNPYDPKTGMTRGYSTPFFMDAFRYQTQVPASLGQRNVNHFFGNYLPYLKDLNREPIVNEEGWINLANNSYSGWNAASNPHQYMIHKPSEDIQYNMPIDKSTNGHPYTSLWGNNPLYWKILDEIKETKPTGRSPSRYFTIPDAESRESMNYIYGRPQSSVEL